MGLKERFHTKVGWGRQMSRVFPSRENTFATMCTNILTFLQHPWGYDNHQPATNMNKKGRKRKMDGLVMIESGPRQGTNI